jgi:uvrABC system protein B
MGNIKGRLKGKNKIKVGEIHNEEDAIKEIAKLEKAMQQAAREGCCVEGQDSGD